MSNLTRVSLSLVMSKRKIKWNRYEKIQTNFNRIWRLHLSIWVHLTLILSKKQISLTRPIRKVILFSFFFYWIYSIDTAPTNITCATRFYFPTDNNQPFSGGKKQTRIFRRDYITRVMRSRPADRRRHKHRSIHIYMIKHSNCDCIIRPFPSRIARDYLCVYVNVILR